MTVFNFIRFGIAMLLVAVAGFTFPGQSPGQGNGKRPRISQGKLTDGELAPDFTLLDGDHKNEVTLSKLRGKPVVLVFGSCTCPPFVASTQAAEKLHEQYHDRVHFYLVYIREAHPIDGRAIANNQFRKAARWGRVTALGRSQIRRPKNTFHNQHYLPPAPPLLHLKPDQLQKAILPVRDVRYAVELRIIIAQKVETRPFGYVLPILVEDIDSISVAEVLKHNEIACKLRTEV